MNTPTPAEWFADPQLDGPTPLTVLEDGRVLGHLAVWGTCHVGIRESCVQPPRSYSGYRYFRLGAVATTSGEHDVGQITLDTGHAPLAYGAEATIRHYDDTGTAVADVACGEDAWGIWFAGALRPGVAEETAAVLRGAKLSGDWRQIGGQLELVGMLAVNVPGFPVPRTRARVASGGPEALVAAGMLPRSPVVLGEARERLVAALLERQRTREQLAALLARAKQ